MLLYGPQGVSFVSSTMIIAESGNKIVRKIQSSSGSTIAGTPPGSANGVGSSARFYLPRNLSTDGSSVWIVDGFNHVLRSLEPDLHAVGILAGVVQANNPALDETDGSAETALFLYPSGITQVGSSVFICDITAQTDPETRPRYRAGHDLCGNVVQHGEYRQYRSGCELQYARLR